MNVSSKAEDRSLRPAELATAAVMSSFTVALTVIAVVVPLASALQILATVPMAIVAQRHRTRALVTAAVAGTLVGFVAAGLTTAITVATCALLGGLCGRAKRKGQGFFGVLLTSLVIGPVLGLVMVTILLILAPLRELFLKTLDNTLEGVARLLARSELLTPAADGLRGAVGVVLDNWWWFVGGGVAFSIVSGTLFTWLILGAVLDRLALIPAHDHLTADDGGREIGPLPVRLDGVGYRYPGSGPWALNRIDLSIEPGEFVAVVGPNGSGKSTLTRILAGRDATAGVVSRPGAPGLGKVGGTAVVLQRPESQILGTRVADDVVWGLPDDVRPDIALLLLEVGLTGMADRETQSLSGGEMQRLAVAAALARRPALLIADEATTMVDREGRETLVALLAELPRRHPMAVVLVTHQESETTSADRVIRLHEGGQIAHSPEWMVARNRRPAAVPYRPGPPILTLRNVHHTYNRHTPWSQTALNGVDLDVAKGEGILVLGGNGSGKSTLAWILAGLQKPTSGTALLDGKPITAKVGTVGLAFQHSRLQLQRRSVAEDITASAGPEVGSARVAWAMDAVGLDRLMAGRDIDALSGGQMRRVVLAGLVVRKPRVLVLDEPLAGLDPPGRSDIIGVLADLRAQGISIIVISHDIDGMDAVCTRTITLEAGRITSGIAAPSVTR